MKPFDLELAKAGHPVCTRDGRKVRIICFDKKDEDFPIIALLDFGNYESIATYTLEGRFMVREESNNDLFMAPNRKEGWINICSYGDNRNACFGIYNTKEEALSHKISDEYVDTIKIEWEE